MSAFQHCPHCLRGYTGNACRCDVERRRADVMARQNTWVTLRWFNRTYIGLVVNPDDKGFLVHDPEWGEGCWCSWEHPYRIDAMIKEHG